MATTKIVLIGAGSTSFGAGTLLDVIAKREALRGSTIVLNDVNQESLDLMLAVAQRANAATGSLLTFEATADQRAALDGAEFVITAIEEERIPGWQQDWEIPLRYGIKQVLGENGGPGGLGHTLRVVDLMLRVAGNIEDVAPDAWLLNFTNPMSRVCLGLSRGTSLKIVGLCHQIGEGYRIVGKVFGLLDEEGDYREQAEHLLRKLDIKAAGLNHYTFIYDIRDKETGEDLYPEFKRRLAGMPADFEPLSRRLLDAFGYFPATGDGHAGEYVSFAWETSDMKGYDFQGYLKDSADGKARLREAAENPEILEKYLGWSSGERAIAIIDAILHNRNQYELAVNLPNRGCLPGVPDWAVVEVPGLVSGAGVRGLSVPAFPPGLTALFNQQVAVQDRAVYAAMHGDRQAALQALLLDPVVTSYEAATRILDDLLAAHARYLPRFA